MHLKFMNETMNFNSKGFQGFILRTFRCNYDKLREKDRTYSLITFTKQLFICSRSFLSHSLITTNFRVIIMSLMNVNQAS